MSPLPNLKECDDNELAESLSDSEDTLTAKFAERMKQRWEAHECEECEVRERAEHEAWEARERAERKEQEERDTRKRQSREERERSAREEVRRGKVSAQRFRRQRPWGTTDRIFLLFLASGGGGLGRGHCVHLMPRKGQGVHAG